MPDTTAGQPPTPVPVPAYERLPEYDDEPQVNAHILEAWLHDELPDRWMAPMADSEGCPCDISNCAGKAAYQRNLIVDVIGALQSVGDATIVKNATYRAMVRDGREIERLAAGLAKLGLSGRMAVEHDGNPVSTALEVAEVAGGTAQAWANVCAVLEQQGLMRDMRTVADAMLDGEEGGDA